jgi:DNA-binding helix-hairpin-helix protein with protein kinase domain
MTEFKSGDKVNLLGGPCAVIEKRLGAGGQGIVYAITIDGKPYALKWYTCKFKDKDAFRKNMEKNIADGPPDGKFLWPLFMTGEQNDSFGYVMHLRPREYSEFSDILNKKVDFPSTKLVINSALNIVNGFRSLHRKGLSYQDLNDGNFFINVNTGDVLICDNDNVTPDGKKNSGNIGGKPGYMAPEIVKGESSPNSLTDCHSLAVILFKLFCRHDPLMGEQYVKGVCITEKREYELYGSNPVFIFDPANDTNRPVKGIHPNPLKLWPVYPAFLQEAFIQSFAEGMKNPNARLPENEWQKVLVRLRDELLQCPSCTDDMFLNRFPKGGTIQCNCGHSYSYPLRLALGKYNVPLFPGVKLYACHTRGGNDDYAVITGEVIMNKNNPALWGIKNLSGDSWLMSPENGEDKNIENGSVIPIASNLSIRFKEITGKIIKE